MKKIIHTLNNINEACGRTIAWLTLAMVCVTFLLVLLRRVLSEGSIALQETITYMHAIVFMLGAAYTLKHNEHVRVDILYQKMDARKKAWVDFLGSLLLLIPFSVFIFFISFDYVQTAWQLKEASRETGGLPFLYLLKTIIPIAAILLTLQGCAICLRCATTLFGLDKTCEEQ